MKENKIRQLLKEFNYDKNTLEDTLQFLLIICTNIVQQLNDKEVKNNEK